MSSETEGGRAAIARAILHANQQAAAEDRWAAHSGSPERVAMHRDHADGWRKVAALLSEAQPGERDAWMERAVLRAWGIIGNARLPGQWGSAAKTWLDDFGRDCHALLARFAASPPAPTREAPSRAADHPYHRPPASGERELDMTAGLLASMEEAWGAPVRLAQPQEAQPVASEAQGGGERWWMLAPVPDCDCVEPWHHNTQAELQEYYESADERMRTALCADKYCSQRHPIIPPRAAPPAAPPAPEGREREALARREFERLAHIAHAFRVALAKRCLADCNRELREAGTPDNWPAQQEWADLVGTSHSTFMAIAAAEAGLAPESVRLFFNQAVYGRVDLDEMPACLRALSNASPRETP